MENELVKIFEDVAGSIKAISDDNNLMTPAEFMDKILATGDPKEFHVSSVDEINNMKYVIPNSTAVIELTKTGNYVWGEPVSQFLFPKYIKKEMGAVGYSRRWPEIPFAMNVDGMCVNYTLPSDEFGYIEYYAQGSEGNLTVFERHTEPFLEGDLIVNLRGEVSIPYKDNACDTLDDFLFVSTKEPGATYDYVDKQWVANTEVTSEDLTALNSILGDDEEIQIDMSDEQIETQLDNIIGGNE